MRWLCVSLLIVNAVCANLVHQDAVSATKNEGDGDGDADQQERAMTASSKGKKSKFNEWIPFLLAPALMLAGIMPWIIPPLKMVVMFVAALNNFAFTSALFMLIRNFIFNPQQEEHIIYVNHGYDHKSKYQVPR